MKQLMMVCALALLLLCGACEQQKPQGNASKGMLRHVVAFNFKSDVPQELIDKILDEARTALPTIPGVSNVVVGPQTSDWTNYKYGVSIDLKDKEAKAVYANSAESKRLHEQFKQYVESEVVIDIFNE